MSVFDHSYAQGYDALYRDKDYAAECDLIERSLGRAAPMRLLDVGCGTGGHALELSRRGHRVTGIDLSAHMLEGARSKARGLGAGLMQPQFIQGDARSFELVDEPPFDGAVMMFAVLGYLNANQDVTAALRNVRRHLVLGAPFAFDVWWGPAVLVQQPGDRVRTVPISDGSLLRATRTALDTSRNVAAVHFDLYRMSQSTPASSSSETHRMRYFFGPELELLAHTCGFELARIGCFPEFDREPSVQSWNVFVLLHAR